MSAYVDPANPNQEVHEICADPGYNMADAPPLGKANVQYHGRAGDFVLECDVYPGEQTGTFVVVLYCPKCSTPKAPHTLKITSDRKHIEFDAVTRKLSVEPFECTWELPEAANRRIAFGAGLCRWRVGISNNVARDA
jgi:hypothetical protein